MPIIGQLAPLRSRASRSNILPPSRNDVSSYWGLIAGCSWRARRCGANAEFRREAREGAKAKQPGPSGVTRAWRTEQGHSLPRSGQVEILGRNLRPVNVPFGARSSWASASRGSPPRKPSIPKGAVRTPCLPRAHGESLVPTPALARSRGKFVPGPRMARKHGVRSTGDFLPG